MTLAEALLEKKALNARISELQIRYVNSAVHEEGEASEEAPEDVLRQLQAAMDETERLTVDINRTNNTVPVESGGLNGTMMEAIARRDSLKVQIGQYNAISSHIRHRNANRRGWGEAQGPKMVAADGVSAIHFTKLVDGLSKELRLLDMAIQAANWQNALVQG
jgi:hypothetical protein